MKNWRTIVGAALAIVLAATLAFLYMKTEAIDFKKQSQILSFLRELKDIDAKWDAELVRSRFDPGKDRLPQRDFAEAMQRALTGLAAETAGSPAVKQSIEALQKAFEEKAALVDKYKAQSAELRDALGGMAATLNEVRAMVGGAVLARPALKARFAELQNNLYEIESEVLRYNLAPDDRQKVRIESAQAALRSAEGQFEPPLRPAVARLNRQVEAVMQKKPGEHELFTKVSFLTAGPRVDSL
jgi:hypothetical protein